MTEKRTTISLELLLLNDLFRTHVINKEIYDKAVQKIISMKNTTQAQVNNQSAILATA